MTVRELISFLETVDSTLQVVFNKNVNDISNINYCNTEYILFDEDDNIYRQVGINKGEKVISLH